MKDESWYLTFLVSVIVDDLLVSNMCKANSNDNVH